MEYLEQRRWKGTPVCPHCGSEKHYRVKTRFKHPDLKDYKDFVCANKSCKKKYTTLTGSIYESSKLGLRVWFTALFLYTRKKSISSLQLASDLGISGKTAWFVLHRIREMVKEKMSKRLEGIVSADETFVGGKNKNRHHDKKVQHNQGRAFVDKTPVAGVMQATEYEVQVDKETGEVKKIPTKPSIVRCKVVPDTKAESIQPFIKENVSKGSVFVSDEWHAYSGLNRDYEHHVVDHGRKQYVDAAGFSSNNMENFWSHAKRNIIGTYHYVSRKHMQRYFDEFSFRHNHRTMTGGERFNELVGRSPGVRLRYRELMRA